MDPTLDTTQAMVLIPATEILATEPTSATEIRDTVATTTVRNIET